MVVAQVSVKVGHHNPKGGLATGIPYFEHRHRTFGSRKQKGPASLQGLVYLGSSTWARTRDLRINSPALYQLSYRGIGKRA
jgi:hypothetical protein